MGIRSTHDVPDFRAMITPITRVVMVRMLRRDPMGVALWHAIVSASRVVSFADAIIGDAESTREERLRAHDQLYAIAQVIRATHDAMWPDTCGVRCGDHGRACIRPDGHEGQHEPWGEGN